MTYIRILQQSIIIFSFLVLITSLILLLKKKQISKLDAIIVYCLSLDSFFNIFTWLLDNITEVKKGFLSYDMLFPLFIIGMVIYPKKKNLFAVSVIGLTLAIQLFIRSSEQLSAPEGLKIGLSFIACLALLYVVFKNIQRVRFQIFMLLLLAGIPFLDIFFNAAFFRYIPFEMDTWIIFLSGYIIYIIIAYCLFIYYYGKQIFKYPSTFK
jgi:hypothetical protein